VIVAAAGIAACSSDSSDATASRDQAQEQEQQVGQQAVSVKLFQFQPKTIEIDAGTEVVWENGDDTVHEPTSGAPGATDPLFDVTIDGVGATGSFTFDVPGTYPYFCQLHTSMTGEVVVR
jgi:plastocyanin